MVDLLGDDDLLDLGERAKSNDPAGVVREERRSKPSPTSNMDLEAIAHPAAEPLAGMCQACKKSPPKLTCHNCSKHVCKSCSWTMLGLCQTCATEDRVSRFNKSHSPEGNNWLD